MATYDYDLIVIGSGPAGQRAAIQAAKLGKSVAILERLPMLGGVDVNTGTASKTMREAVLHLTGFRHRNIHGDSYSVKQNITMSDLMVRTGYVMQQQVDMLRVHFRSNRVETIYAEGSFVDPHTVSLSFPESRLNRTITSDKVIIAVGSFSTTPPIVHVDGRLIFVSDDVLNLPDIPRSLTIVGGGAIGLEYCSTFAALGVRVTLVDRNPRLLQFADDEIVDTLVYHLRQNGVTLRLNENVNDIEYVRDHRGDRVRVMLESGKQIISDAVMYCVGRTGNTANLNLEAAGIQADARGRISVDEEYQTGVPGIYAVGGVIGFPDLTSTSRMQGRLAACHAFRRTNHPLSRPAALHGADYPRGGHGRQNRIRAYRRRRILRSRQGQLPGNHEQRHAGRQRRPAETAFRHRITQVAWGTHPGRGRLGVDSHRTGGDGPRRDG